MARPRKWRKVCSLPLSRRFGPLDHPPVSGPVQMTVDEYETIRLIDLERFTQEDCAQQMQIARTTVQHIYQTARQKLSEALVSGRVLLIEGGEYRLCEDPDHQGCGRGCQRQRRRMGGGRGRGGPGKGFSGPPPRSNSTEQ